MSKQDNSESPVDSEEDLIMDFELDDDNTFSQNVTYIDIQGHDASVLGSSSSIRSQFEPNGADEQKRFECNHLELDGKIFTKQDIRNLIQEKQSLKQHLDVTKKFFRMLKEQVDEERRKCHIRKEDLRIIQSLLQRYSEDQGQH